MVPFLPIEDLHQDCQQVEHQPDRHDDLLPRGSDPHRCPAGFVGQVRKQGPFGMPGEWCWGCGICVSAFRDGSSYRNEITTFWGNNH